MQILAELQIQVPALADSSPVARALVVIQKRQEGWRAPYVVATLEGHCSSVSLTPVDRSNDGYRAAKNAAVKQLIELFAKEDR